MRRILVRISALLLMLCCQNIFAGPGKFFDVTSTGIPSNISLTLCLNGKGPLSCQKYTVAALNLSIRTTIPNHVYPSIGIFINTPGYAVANLGIDCTMINNGYCLFSANNTVPTSITLESTTILPLVVAPPILPAATLHTAYSQSIMASGGVAPYTFAITAGSLPTGLSFNTSTGLISGTPAMDNTFSFTVTITDSSTRTAFNAYSVVVSGPLGMSPSTLPAATLNTAYSQTILASDGVTPYTYAITAGALPTGLSLNTSTGVISGTPTLDSTFNFTVTATDSHSDSGSRAYSVVTSGPLPLLPASLPPMFPLATYNQTITASGGVAPYTYAITAGTLPPGLSLNTSTGVISGTGNASTGGQFNFTVTATDSISNTGSKAYSLGVATLGSCNGGASGDIVCQNNAGITGNFHGTFGGPYVSPSALMLIVGSCPSRGTLFNKINPSTNTEAPLFAASDGGVENVDSEVTGTGSLVGCQLVLCTDNTCAVQSGKSSPVTIF